MAKGALKVTSSTWVLVVTFIAAALLLFIPIRLPTKLGGEGVSCLLYDKPPRTGSTTLANALRGCLEAKGFTSITIPISSIEKDAVIRDMLSKPGKKKSSVIKHVMVSDSDIRKLQRECETLLYVTSSRPMKERISSAAKYGMTKKHGNSTLSKDHYNKVLKRATEDDVTEGLLEKYPFTGRSRIEPNYVIRYERFEEDLSLLLQSLQCSVSVRRANVHEFGDDEADERLKDAISLKFGDARYKELTRLGAERNPDGAAIARTF